MGIYAQLAVIHKQEQEQGRDKKEHHCQKCNHRWASRVTPTLCPNKSCRSAWWCKTNVERRCRCKRCGHDWRANKRKPKACPGCGTTRWRTPPPVPLEPGLTELRKRERELGLVQRRKKAWKENAKDAGKLIKCKCGAEDEFDLATHWRTSHKEEYAKIMEWLGPEPIISFVSLGIARWPTERKGGN